MSHGRQHARKQWQAMLGGVHVECAWDISDINVEDILREPQDGTWAAPSKVAQPTR
jgi:hypothetical protein